MVGNTLLYSTLLSLFSLSVFKYALILPQTLSIPILLSLSRLNGPLYPLVNGR